MKIWEAIIYGIFGGLTELLPLSFQGHYVFLLGAFDLSPLTGTGYYVRAAVCLGLMGAIFLSLPAESGAVGLEILKMTGIKKMRKREQKNVLLRRSILLGLFALIPMLCAFFYLPFAESVTSLLLTALLFMLNGFILFFGFRRTPGHKSQGDCTVLDTLLLGICRALSVFPGLSGLGSSLAVGNARGLSSQYNLRMACIPLLFYEFAAFIFYLVRGILYGTFSAALLISMLLATVFAAVAGYFAISYLRYLLRRDKLELLSYYSWGLGGILLFLSLINA